MPDFILDVYMEPNMLETVVANGHVGTRLNIVDGSKIKVSVVGRMQHPEQHLYEDMLWYIEHKDELPPDYFTRVS